MLQLEIIQKYMKPILYSVLVIVILFVVYKIIQKIGGTATSVTGVIVDKAADTVIGNQLGISNSRLHELRQIALDFANELETNKDYGMFDGLLNVTTVDDIAAIAANVNSYNEMVAVKNYYAGEFTKGNSLKEDIVKAFTYFGKNLSGGALKFPYSEAL
jgi:hypothetical protein